MALCCEKTGTFAAAGMDCRCGDSKSMTLGVLDPSSENRCRVFEAAIPGTAKGLLADFGCGVVPCRCCKVDLRKDMDFLRGESLPACGEPKTGRSFSLPPSSTSSEAVGPPNMRFNDSKSEPPGAPCRLRRFATGLPKSPCSKFMKPSLRFRGLDLTGVLQLCTDRENSNLIGPSFRDMRKFWGRESVLGGASSTSSFPSQVVSADASIDHGGSELP